MKIELVQQYPPLYFYLLTHFRAVQLEFFIIYIFCF